MRVALVGGGLLGAFLLYELVTSFVAYTNDAYVRSDLVAIAPEVTGRIVAVHVVDNQAVKKGDPLATIDPVPFQLVIAQRQAEIEEAKAQLAADQDIIAAARDAYNSASAALAFARVTQERIAKLTSTDDVSRQQLDQANDALQRAGASLAGSEADLAKARAHAGFAPGRASPGGGGYGDRAMGAVANPSGRPHRRHHQQSDATRRATPRKRTCR